MIDKIFHRNQRSINELILEATRELGKCYSRIELAYSKLKKRNQELFEACIFYTKKGSKTRATIYANEIAEIRRILSVFEYAKLSIERAILRLDTLRTVSPALEPLQETFREVRNALGLVAKAMPSMTLEINKLSGVVNEILDDTAFNLSMPMVTGVNDPNAEAILREAASVVEEEFKAKIPEPPLEKEKIRPVRATRPLLALSIMDQNSYSGSTVLEEDSEKDAKRSFDLSSFLAEELVMDYIERNGGDMNISRCAKELNMPYDWVLQAVESLKRKGKIEIQQ